MQRNYFVLLFFISITYVVSAQDTCRFMTYNVLNFDNTGNNKEHFLRTVIDSMHPDILVVQEINYLEGAERFRDSVMTVIDTNYAMGDFIDSYDTDNGLFYRKDKFSFLDNFPIHTDIRDINRFGLMHRCDSTVFYVFSVHLKASSGSSNEVLRKQEIDSLRKYTALLPDTANYIVTGDFNIYKSTEDAYVTLLDNTEPGYFIDPLGELISGTWNNAAYAPYHTQSTRVRAFGGGSTGGLDDRFDLMLFSQAIEDSGGMEYISGSTEAVGNDGNHFDDSLNAMPNTYGSEDFINALYQSSDHIPVIAEFIFTDFPAGGCNVVPVPLAEIPVNQISVFPNPVSGYLNISSNRVGVTFRLFDIHGIEVMHFTSDNTGPVIEDLHVLQPGLYILSADGLVIDKVVVIR